MLDILVVVYLDNILIYSENKVDHIKHVLTVLEKLAEAALYVKLEKCDFYKTSIEFLGFIVSIEGVSIDSLKVDTIRSWLTPTTVKQV